MSGPATKQEGSAVRSEMLSDTTKNFSLLLGGPFYQYLLRLGLVKAPLDRVGWRMIVITLFAWAPLLVLTILSGHLLSGVKIPFLRDIEVHARLLIALPLLIAAEVVINARLRMILLQFVDRQIITSAVISKFEQITESAIPLRNSAMIELGLLAFIFIAGAFWWKGILAIQSDTWYAATTASGKVFTPAGYWCRFVSLPFFQFIWLRWYLRLAIWARLLWQVSRLDLNLVPSHPDRCCGLGFLGESAFAMWPFLLSHSVLFSGFFADRILYEGGKLPDYRIEIVLLALFLYLLALGPTCVFAPRLIRRRREGLSAYGALASEYVIGFHSKWIEGQRPSDEPLVGTADIQSLADLANSFEVVQHIRPFPFGRPAIIAVAVLTALPILPLSLTMFSPQELVAQLLRVLI
ncbi:MAG TPA: hypothetical protein VMT15_19635 [Bryobacteraceae bacterium]|nr:hypothetical protein [Bryobacteraceae bacterium]